MGIDIPPPKGGPATFPKELQTPLTPEGDKPKSVEPPQDSEQNDSLSLSLSECRGNLLFKNVLIDVFYCISNYFSVGQDFFSYYGFVF